MKIAEVMTGDPFCIQQDEPLHQAHRLMRGRRVRHLPVLDGDRLVGILSERDLYLLETVRGVDPAREPVSEAMTEQPYAVGPDTDVDDVVREMLRKKYGSAVVLKGGRVSGIFTRSDALRVFVKMLEPR
jgi:acetoin utilization protein AcuB